MSKFKITIGDQTHEVEVDDIEVPEGFVLQSQKVYDAAMIDRASRERRSADKEHKTATEALLSDDDFFSKAATRRGIELNEEGLPDAKIDPEKLQRHQTQWKAEFLDPVLKENADLKTDVVSGIRSTLERDVFAAMPDAGVKNIHLRTFLKKGEMPAFVRDVADLFTYDPDRKDHFFEDKTGNPVYDGAKYAGPDKLLIELRRKDEDHDYFDDKRPHASGFRKPGSGTGNGQKVISKETFEAGGAKLEDVADGKVTIVD